MIMDLKTIIALMTLIITIMGWIILHLLTKRRDSINKKKEIRIKYLIDAWRLLESASNRKNNDRNTNIEIAVADIQLFGSRKQIELAQKIAIDLSRTGTGESLELLKELRTDLRKELKLEKVPDTFRYIRFEEKNSTNNEKKHEHSV